MQSSNNVLVKVEKLKKHFVLDRKATLHAVDDVSFEINRGETLGLVGESGCGKSTLGRTIAGMYQPTAGHVSLGDQAPTKFSWFKKPKAGRAVQMIFQDPQASLNPRMTVGDIIAEGPDVHGLWSKAQRPLKIAFWLQRVGLSPEHAARFPHEFSGGQRQRIGLARALAVEPKFLVCDEPISALDVSIQAQIVTLLQDLQKEFGLTYLFIAHGLSMVRYISHRMAVMYLGKIVEIGGADDVYFRPLHPYTKALIAANPQPDPKRERARPRVLLGGELTTPINPKPGCQFAARCTLVSDRCRQETPALREVSAGRSVACHFA